MMSYVYVYVTCRLYIPCILFLLSVASPCFGLVKFQGYCQQGNGTVQVAGYTSIINAPTAPPVMSNFPSATVNVYSPGTTTNVPIYSNSTGTTKSNPFTADSNGYWFFYAPGGSYDLNCSGTPISTPFTYGNLSQADPYFQFPGTVPLASGSVPVPVGTILGYPIYASYFGAVCDGVTDDGASLAQTISVCEATGGHIILPRTGHLCGTKRSLDMGTSGSAVGCVLDGSQNGNVSGISVLSGATLSTYTSGFDSSTHSYVISFGGTGGETCTALMYSTVQNIYIQGNNIPDTAMLNRCGQEQSGFFNIITNGFNYTGFEGMQASQDGEGGGWTLYPNANAYGMLLGAFAKTSYHDISIAGEEASGGVSTKPGILVYSAGSPHLSDIHCEATAGCVSVVSNSVLIDRMDSGPTESQAALIIGASSTGATLHLLTGNGLNINGMVKDSLVESAQTCLGFNMIEYVSAVDVGGSGPFHKDTFGCFDELLPKGLTMKGILNMPNNGTINFGTHETLIDAGDSLAIVSNTGSPEGFQFQSVATAGHGTKDGGGLNCTGGGLGGDVTSGGCIGGAVSVSAGSYQTVATATASSGMFVQSGTGCLYGATGLTGDTNYTAIFGSTCALSFSQNGTQDLPVAFANLGAVPAAGFKKYCTNCTTAATCASGGSGHEAVSNGSIWTCQ